MKSDFERRAAQEAVDAVERRVQRKQDEVRRMRARTRKAHVAAIVFLLTVAIVGGVALWVRFSDGDASSLLSSLNVRSVFRRADASAGDRRHYGDLLNLLLKGPVHPSSELPAELSLKNAKPGTRYALLATPQEGWFGLYELERSVSGKLVISELSPVGPPREISGADLKEASAGKPHLVAVGGQVYLFAGKNHADATHLRSEVRALIR